MATQTPEVGNNPSIGPSEPLTTGQSGYGTPENTPPSESNNDPFSLLKDNPSYSKFVSENPMDTMQKILGSLDEATKQYTQKNQEYSKLQGDYDELRKLALTQLQSSQTQQQPQQDTPNFSSMTTDQINQYLTDNPITGIQQIMQSVLAEQKSAYDKEIGELKAAFNTYSGQFDAMLINSTQNYLKDNYGKYDPNIEENIKEAASTLLLPGGGQQLQMAGGNIAVAIENAYKAVLATKMFTDPSYQNRMIQSWQQNTQQQQNGKQAATMMTTANQPPGMTQQQQPFNQQFNPASGQNGVPSPHDVAMSIARHGNIHMAPEIGPVVRNYDMGIY